MVHRAGSIPARVLEVDDDQDEAEDEPEPMSVLRRFVVRGSELIEVGTVPRRETR